VPQPKSSGGGPSRGSRRPAGGRRAAAKPAQGRKPASKRTPASKRPRSKAKPAAAKPAARRAASKPKAKPKSSARRGKPAAKRAAKRTAAPASNAARQSDDALRTSLASMRDFLTRGVVITGERVQETVDDAVRRGRMMPQDAEELVTSLLSIGRQQTQDLLADIEQLLGRTRSAAGTAAGTSAAGATAASKRARTRGAEAQDKVLQRVDKARRAAGIGTFPVLNYDDLTASQIVDRVMDLTPAELRKVRDYEKRNANRKSVLDAIARRLS
jgi:polyhydroxyalkanoate synthesis regulator phasin